jgi:hypothetical protein
VLIKKNKNPLVTIPYEEVEFVWVSSHWDIHLIGLCRYNKELCLFTTDYNTLITSIYKLSFSQQVDWTIKKTLFEWCVGYHWTYPKRKNIYNKRWPRWFWIKVMHFYYWNKKKFKRYRWLEE